MKRRLLPWILSASLCLSLLPAGSFSAEGESQMACSCTQYCPEAGTDETCMVCVNDPANCTGKGTAAFSETPEITETMESAEVQSEWESEEQSETEPVTEEVSVESEEETTKSSESETDFQEPPSEEVPGEESEETEETNETEETESSGETEGPEEETEETATQESSAQSEGITPTLEEIQELIYSLPGAEEMENLSAEEKEAVYAKVQEIRSMLEGLTEEERALLDTTRLEGFLMQTAEKKAKTLRAGNVAEILVNGSHHSYASSLQDAIDSAPNGATIKLLQSIAHVSCTISGKTLTLDMNQCATDLLNINLRSSTLNIENGSVQCVNCDFGNTVNLLSGSVSDLYCHAGGATVNISGGTVSKLTSYASTVNITGGEVETLEYGWKSTVYVAGGTIYGLKEVDQGGTFIYCATSIKLTDTALSMNSGDTKTLSATVGRAYKDPNGCLGAPTVTWESKNPDVATVDESSGLITAVGAGEATITASVPAMNDERSIRASCKVTVKDVVKLSVKASEGGRAYINTDPYYTVGEDTYYVRNDDVTVTATAEEGYCFAGWKGKDAGDTFDSTEASYTFNIQEDTELTAVFQKGVARVTHNGTTSMYATLNQAFSAAGDGATIELLEKNTETVLISGSKTLTLVGNGCSTGNLQIQGGTIEIHNLAVGMLDVKGGTVSISGSSVKTYLSCTGSGTVSIMGGSVQELSCSGSGTVNISDGNVGDLYGDGGKVNILGGDVSSLHCYGGTVNVAGGTIEGLEKNGGTVNYYAKSIALDDELSMKRGENKTLSATVDKAYNDPNGCLGTPAVTWKSEDTSIATVDESSGEIIAVGPGSTEITASVPTMYSPGEPGSTEAICTVTVSDGVKLSVKATGDGKAYINTDPYYMVGEDTYYVRNDDVTVTAEAGEEYYFAGWKGKDADDTFDSTEANYTFKIGADTELTAVFQKGAAQILKDGTKKTCATLDQAISEAGDGATIVLLQDITETISINVNKTLTLDGNGCSTGDIEINSGTVNVQNLVNGVLDVNGGTVNVSSDIGIPLRCNGGIVNITDGSVGSLTCYDGTVNIMGGRVKQLDSRGGKINVAGGTIDGLEKNGGTVNYYATGIELTDAETGIELTDTKLSLKREENKELSATVAVAYSSPNNSLGNPTVTWKSGDENVVKVDESSGLITVVGPGTAVITAFVQRMDSPETTSTISASCTVKVDGVKLDVKEPEKGGTVKIEPEPSYTAGEDTYYTGKVTVKAEAEEGHHFAGWQNKDGEIVSTEASYTFEMGADTELTAVFHEFDTAVYASDADSHWHPCKEDGCEAREDIEPHKGEETGDCTKEETCTVCGYVIRAAQAEHDWAEATCKEPKKCKREGCTQTEGEKADHKFTNYISDGNATCIADGTKTAECDYGCKETDTIQDVGSKLDHEKVIDEAVAPTAEAEGLTEGSHCKNCGAILVKQEVIAKLTPSKSTEPAKATEVAKATETQVAGTSAAGQKTETTPNTGDEHHPLAYLWLMLAAGALGGVMIRRRKKV